MDVQSAVGLGEGAWVGGEVQPLQVNKHSWKTLEQRLASKINEQSPLVSFSTKQLTVGLREGVADGIEDGNALGVLVVGDIDGEAVGWAVHPPHVNLQLSSAT